MIDFGYKIVTTRVLELDKADFTLSVKLFKEDEMLRACIGCGACSGGCTAAAHTNFNFRRLHTLIRRGDYTNARQEAEKCMLCGRCMMICPRGINTRKIVQGIKRLF